jgi:hypothetical protein
VRGLFRPRGRDFSQSNQEVSAFENWLNAQAAVQRKEASAIFSFRLARAKHSPFTFVIALLDDTSFGAGGRSLCAQQYMAVFFHLTLRPMDNDFVAIIIKPLV